MLPATPRTRLIANQGLPSTDMSNSPLQTTYIPHLRSQFTNATPILFLGAGFSLDGKTRSGQHIPSTQVLTERLWQLCFPGEPFDHTTQLQDIYETARATHKPQLTSILHTGFSVDADSCPDWYYAILGMPWAKIYTLNIDDLVENVLSAAPRHREIASVSATSGQHVPDETTNLSVIHLNGTLDDVPDGVTFSRSQYARRHASADHAYHHLMADLKYRPVVFIGSNLDEPPLWQHLELRGEKAQGRELRPRSYLVTPKLNRSREALLTKHNIVHLPYTAATFCADVLARLARAGTAGNELIRSRAARPQRDAEAFTTVSTLATDPVPSEEYLLGAEPTWDDVNKGRIANRSCFDELWEEIATIRRDRDGTRFLLVTGTAGTGKTSALMVAATQLQADGLRVAWLDQDSTFSLPAFRRALRKSPKADAIFINDADMYGRGFARMVVDALSTSSDLIIVAEARNSRRDDMLDRPQLGVVRCTEYSVPGLTDGDIDAVLDVLEQEQRLGKLRQKSRHERKGIFQRLAGRQMLVAMHIATHGKDHKTKAIEELRQLPPLRRYIYGVICVATARRLSLTKDDIGIAVGSTELEWLQELDHLQRSKLVRALGDNRLRARHRVIAQFAYESLEQDGEISEVIRGLVVIGATKTSSITPRGSRYYRLLQTFLNHNLLSNSVGLAKAREIYGEFQTALDWNHHYWLHRGAIELESGSLELAENFLGQAKALGPDDIMVDNELAYLMFKKANANPAAEDSPTLVEEAIDGLLRITRARPDLASGHCYHIIGREGLRWSDSGIKLFEKRVEFLQRIRHIVREGGILHPTPMVLEVKQTVERAYLNLAVREG